MKPALRYSMQETLENWFASNSLEIKNIGVIRNSETDRLIEAAGEFHPVAFDHETDGPKMSIRYQLEVALSDERFAGTELKFTSETKFEIE
jgi:hypothetical protein